MERLTTRLSTIKGHPPPLNVRTTKITCFSYFFLLPALSRRVLAFSFKPLLFDTPTASTNSLIRLIPSASHHVRTRLRLSPKRQFALSRGHRSHVPRGWIRMPRNPPPQPAFWAHRRLDQTQPERGHARGVDTGLGCKDPLRQPRSGLYARPPGLHGFLK